MNSSELDPQFRAISLLLILELEWLFSGLWELYEYSLDPRLLLEMLRKQLLVCILPFQSLDKISSKTNVFNLNELQFIRSLMA